MVEINIETFFNKLDEIKSELYALKSEVRANKSHEAPCSFLCDHMTGQSEKIKDLHNQHKEHIEEHHSSKNTRDNWAAYAAVICALATIASVVVSASVK